jgi:hypothetical protein
MIQTVQDCTGTVVLPYKYNTFYEQYYLDYQINIFIIIFFNILTRTTVLPHPGTGRTRCLLFLFVLPLALDAVISPEELAKQHEV